MNRNRDEHSGALLSVVLLVVAVSLGAVVLVALLVIAWGEST